MTTTRQDPERHALIVSIFATVGISFLGILWGLAIGSQMILFDGFFGLIGIITSGLMLRASMLAARKPSRLFPYGQQSTTPLVIGIQGFVILATLAYAAVESAITIRNGGSHFLESKHYGGIDTYADPAMTVAQEHETHNLLEEELEKQLYQIWLNLDLLPLTKFPGMASDGQPVHSS